jgi:holo-ACP synthase CitX
VISLDQLLESRDARAQHQKDLLGRFPGKSLLCLTVQLPGPEKRNDLSLAIARAGVSAIRQAFQTSYEELRDLETGYEGYFLVSLPADEAKRCTCRIEDTHPLGRLLDIDVMPGVPGHIGPISRDSLGLSPRKCLLCDNEARYCIRAKTHSTSELLERIGQMVKAYGA